MATKTVKPKEATTVAIAPAPATVVETLRVNSEGLVKSCTGLAVVDITGAQSASDLLDRIATAIKATTARRLEITRPLDAAKASVMDLFRPLISNLEEADRSVRKALVGFETARREAEAKAQREATAAREKALREEQERADAAKAAHDAGIPAETVAEMLPAAPVVPVIPVAAPAVVRSEGGSGITYVDEWHVEVTDATLVPRDYLVPDEAKIRKVVKAGVRDIPGCRIWPTKEVRRA